jgi:hypothetical protein
MYSELVGSIGDRKGIVRFIAVRRDPDETADACRAELVRALESECPVKRIIECKRGGGLREGGGRPR